MSHPPPILNRVKTYEDVDKEREERDVVSLTKELTEVLFDSVFKKYQENTTEGCDFDFDYIDRLFYGSHKVTLLRGGLFI